MFATTRLVWSQLFGVPTFDPLTIGAAVLVLLICAGVALLVPVRRATGDASGSQHRVAMTPFETRDS